MVAVAGVIMNFVKTSQCELQKAFKSFSFVKLQHDKKDKKLFHKITSSMIHF